MKSLNLSDYSSILFDMDGTILNSEPLHMLALQQLLHDSGIDIKLENLEKLYYGLDDTAVYHDLIKSYPELYMSLESFLDNKNRLYSLILDKIDEQELETLVTPGFRKFFSKVQPTHKLGVVSASEKDVVYKTLKRLKLLDNLQVIEYRKDNIESKPSPRPYSMAMEQTQSAPEKTLIFEDSKTGMDAALNSGAKVVHINCFTRPTKRIKSIRNFKRL
jgi:beta-phosphoglucomutase-like phosphatase (HAD superfamily)